MTSPLTPEQILARAPHEYNVPGGVAQAVLRAPQNLCIALLKLYRTIVSPLYGTCAATSPPARPTHWRRSRATGPCEDWD